MENSFIFILVAFVIVLVFTFVAIFGFLIRMQTLLTATQTALFHAQQETGAMRRALTATNTQGKWGEMQLRRIVELAGMLAYCDFDSQVALPSGQRPDLLVRLSDGRTIIVDAKAPINTYIEAHASVDDAAKIAELRLYAKRVRDHVKALAKKEYWHNVDPSPAWVILLIPNEGMFRAAVENDRMLLDDAMQQNILLASPITLLAVLKAMAYSWQQENRANNVHLIVEHSRKLEKELKVFITQWRALQGKLSSTVVAFNQFTNSYQTTIFPAVQRICELDVIINAKEYDLSRNSPLQGPESIEDLLVLTKENIAEI